MDRDDYAWARSKENERHRKELRRLRDEFRRHRARRLILAYLGPSISVTTAAAMSGTTGPTAKQILSEFGTYGYRDDELRYILHSRAPSVLGISDDELRAAGAINLNGAWMSG